MHSTGQVDCKRFANRESNRNQEHDAAQQHRRILPTPAGSHCRNMSQPYPQRLHLDLQELVSSYATVWAFNFLPFLPTTIHSSARLGTLAIIFPHLLWFLNKHILIATFQWQMGIREVTRIMIKPWIFIMIHTDPQCMFFVSSMKTWQTRCFTLHFANARKAIPSRIWNLVFIETCSRITTPKPVDLKKTIWDTHTGQNNMCNV